MTILLQVLEDCVAVVLRCVGGDVRRCESSEEGMCGGGACVRSYLHDYEI